MARHSLTFCHPCGRDPSRPFGMTSFHSFPPSFVSCFIAAAVFAAFLLPTAPARGQLLNDMTDALVRLEKPVLTKLGKADRYQSRSLDVQAEYNGVAFSARSDAPEISGWIRFRDDGRWTDWSPMHIVRSVADEAVMGGYRGDVFRSTPFEMRFELDVGHRFTLIGSGVFDNRNDVDGRPDRRPAPDRAPKQLHDAADIAPPLITRDEWNAASFVGEPVPLANPSYDYMTFHHAAGFRATTREEGLAQVKAIQDLHQNVRGWSDIGYQFVVDRGGRLYQGRPFLDAGTTLDELPRLALGAHVGGFNTGNIGICLLGCYHPSEGSFCTDTITPDAYDTYVQTFAFLSENYGVLPDQIRGHRDFSSTACPGDNNYVLLPQLIVDVESFVPEIIATPEALTLEPNYPNPFSDETVLRYYLHEGGIVRLKIYDATGREVAVLVDEFQEGSSWYPVDFDARSVSAGTYFYRVEVTGIGNRKSSRTGTMTAVR